MLVFLELIASQVIALLLGGVIVVILPGLLGAKDFLDLSRYEIVGLLLALFVVGWVVSWVIHRLRTAPKPQRTAPKPQESVPPIKPPDSRVIIEQAPEHLIAMCPDNLLDVELDRVIAPYLGKWIYVVGNVRQVSKQWEIVSMLLDVLGGSPPFTNYCSLWFDAATWADRLNLVTRGSRIRVLGRIDKIAPNSLQLSGCELASDA
jgi:hypothetical protein